MFSDLIPKLVNIQVLGWELVDVHIPRSKGPARRLAFKTKVLPFKPCEGIVALSCGKKLIS